MNQQEALRRWLRIAWEQGQKTECLVGRVCKAMPVEEAIRELDRPPESVYCHLKGIYCSLPVTMAGHYGRLVQEPTLKEPMERRDRPPVWWPMWLWITRMR